MGGPIAEVSERKKSMNLTSVTWMEKGSKGLKDKKKEFSLNVRMGINPMPGR